MAEIPDPLHTTAQRIYKLHEQAARPARPYLGASELGEACRRRLWLRFRWAEEEQIEGRILRLFDTGQREEERLLHELEALGYEVAGQQFEVVFADGHGRGHLDAAVLGLEEAPKTWHVVDVKTAKVKKFDEVVRKGCDSVFPRYVTQVQVYMGLTGMERAAIFFVCKDDDRIHCERIHFDKAQFAALMKKADDLVALKEPPPKISEDPAWYECRFCEFREQCHGTTAPLPGCRTCAHATPGTGGSWRCELAEIDRDEDFQRLGCEDHVYIPALVASFAEMVDASDGVTWKNRLTGRLFKQPDYLSREMRAAEDKRLLGEEGVDQFKGVFGRARIVNTKATSPVPPRHDDFSDIPWSDDGSNTVGGDEAGAQERPRKAGGRQRRLPVV